MRHDEFRTHIKASKWPSLSPSSCNRPLTLCSFSKNLLLMKSEPQGTGICLRISNTHLVMKRLLGAQGLEELTSHSCILLTSLPSRSLSLFAQSLTGVSLLLKVACIGPEKVLCAKQKTGWHHLLTSVLLLRIHRVSLVSISCASRSSVL